MTSDRSNLLAAIRANPADDTPRLVFADWLDEHGDEGNRPRAEFILAQIDASRGATLESLQLWHLLHHSAGWFPDVCQSLGLGVHHWGVMHDNTVHFEHKNTANEFFVRRGFVDEIRCSLGQWMGGTCQRCNGYGHHHRNDSLTVDEVRRGFPGLVCKRCHGETRVPALGPSLVAAHPLARVILTDREPTQNVLSLTWMWVRVSGMSNPPRDELPSELFDCLEPNPKSPYHVFGRPGDWRSWATRDAAINALSDACLAWARTQPSPPPVLAPG